MSLSASDRIALNRYAREQQLKRVQLDAPAHRPIPVRLYVWSVGVCVALVSAWVLA